MKDNKNISFIYPSCPTCEKISSISKLKISNCPNEHANALLAILKQVPHNDDYICANFILPREWGKIDCILLCNGYIIIFKIVKKVSTRQIIELVDSCLDLSYFHEVSRKIPLIPVIFDSKALNIASNLNFSPRFWHNVANPFICSDAKVLIELIKCLDFSINTDSINIKEWRESAFSPIVQFDYLCNIVNNFPNSAERWFHKNVVALIGEIKRLSQDRRASIIIINGIPGSGKTIIKNFLQQTLDKEIYLTYEFNIYQPIESCREFDRIIQKYSYKKQNMTFICILNEYLSQKEHIANIRQIAMQNELAIEEYSDNNTGNPRLFLSRCLRIFRSSLIFDFWSSVLLQETSLAKHFLQKIPQNNSHLRYRILLSRNLKEANYLLHCLKHGSEKVGIISSELVDCLEFEYAIFRIKSNFVDYMTNCSKFKAHNSNLLGTENHLFYSKFITLILKARQGIIIYVPCNNCRFDSVYTYLHNEIGIKNIKETHDILELTNGMETR